MFTCFHFHKLKYNKGQLAPFFIVFLVILTIMAMITVNLSKVSFIKTDSANSADAGSLAAGSVMANNFNAIAQANSVMIKAYWEFYATISVSFMLALLSLTMAYVKADSALTLAGLAEAQIIIAKAVASPATAAAAAAKSSLASTAASVTGTWLTALIAAITAISLAVLFYSIAQYFMYLSIRRLAAKYRIKAIEMGHQLVFINSGISSKLKEGAERDNFSDFLDSIGSAETYNYSWADGQGRAHAVASQVQIDPVETFDLRATNLPSPAITAALLAGRLFATSAAAEMVGAVAAYSSVTLSMSLAIGKAAACNAGVLAACVAYGTLVTGAGIVLGIGMGNNTAAVGSLTWIFPLLAVAWLGLLAEPGIVYSSGRGAEDIIFIIAWIEDIDHNRKVNVDTTQQHAGADLGLWSTQYPNIHSMSQADFNFEDGGKIYPVTEKTLSHDPIIVLTDILKP